MFAVKNKVVLVTGGANGLGFFIAKEFLEEEAKFVALLDIDDDKGNEAEQQFNKEYGSNKTKFIKCDVSTSDLDAAYDVVINMFGYIDVVVNNAGINMESPDMYLKEIAINFACDKLRNHGSVPKFQTSLITSSLKAYNLMRKDRGGKEGTIVNVSSALAFMNMSSSPIYNATKAGVLKFTTSLGMEPNYSRSGVRFVCLCFGATDTPILRKFLGIDNETQKDFANDLKNIVLQSPIKTAKSTMTVFKNGASGTAWLIAADKPPKDITGLLNSIHDTVMEEVIE